MGAPNFFLSPKFPFNTGKTLWVLKVGVFGAFLINKQNLAPAPQPPPPPFGGSPVGYKEKMVWEFKPPRNFSALKECGLGFFEKIGKKGKFWGLFK